MNYKKLIYIFLAALTINACTPTEKSAEQVNDAAGTKSALELAWDEVMVVHDEVMPKMGDLNKLKKQLLQDSLKNADLIGEVTTAEEDMWNWMHKLTPFEKVKAMSEEDAKAYLDKELKSVTEVKRSMLKSIERAEQELQKNSN